MSRKKVKSAGKIPQDFTAGIKVFFATRHRKFSGKKILDKVIIVTADGKFVLKTDKITAA